MIFDLSGNFKPPHQYCAARSRILLAKFGGQRAFLDKLTSRPPLTYRVASKPPEMSRWSVKDPAD